MKCTTTHHMGCDCHEASWATEVRELRRRLARALWAVRFYSSSKNFSGVYRDEEGGIIEEVDDIGGDVSEYGKDGHAEFGLAAWDVIWAERAELSARRKGVK